MKVVTMAAPTKPINTTHQRRRSSASSMADYNQPVVILGGG
ncbi:hypothetical protein ACL02T_10955 [Pseudonocardia sp. RS010]